MPIRDVAAFGRPDQPTYSRGANGIDGTVATALGLGTDSVLLGDLALRHDIGGLLAAKELERDLDVFCVDNSGGGIFHLLPIAQHERVFEPYFATPQSTDLESVARGLGAKTVTVQTVSELREVACSRPKGLRVCVIKIDRAASVASRTQAIAGAVHALDEGGGSWSM